MKTFDIHTLSSSNTDTIVSELTRGKKVRLTSGGKHIGTAVPIEEEEGELKESFVNEVLRRSKQGKTVPFAKVLRELW